MQKIYVIKFGKNVTRSIFLSAFPCSPLDRCVAKNCAFYIPTFKTRHCTKHLMQWISVWWLLFPLTGGGLGPSVAF